MTCPRCGIEVHYTARCPKCDCNVTEDAESLNPTSRTEPQSEGTSSGPKLSRVLAAVVVVAALVLLFYFGTGFFVVQPIGALPEGTTVWFWRMGTNLPFVSSVDGLLLKRGELSLLGRGVALAAVAEPIAQRKILNLPYSKTLYLVSTGGKEFAH